jgi:C-terminal processing protease CtpA/Prc
MTSRHKTPSRHRSSGGARSRGSANGRNGDRSLSEEERRLIVDQAIVLLEGFYVHLPLKRSMYAINPVQRLRLLRHRLGQFDDEDKFHAEMIDIFTSLRDQHTQYYRPGLTGGAAMLPFMVEAFGQPEAHRYLVSKIKEGFVSPLPSFRPGVEVLSWNGVDIKRAVELAGERTAGANRDARHALGLTRLTQRALDVAPHPDEKWVIVGYTADGRNEEEARFEWTLDVLPPEDHTTDVSLSQSLETDRVRRMRKSYYAAQPTKAGAPKGKAAPGRPVVAPTKMPNVFRATKVPTRHGTFGHVRIFTFEVRSPDRLVREFIRLAKLLPKNGLIVDVRSNGGGRIWAAETLLQILTPKRPIEPEQLYFINTPLTLEVCRLQKSNRRLGPKGARPWIESINRSMETGAPFSASFPYTDPDDCNRERPYPGPVIVITDAECYSATEFFAAGFQDHGGRILGVDRTTGGGGANVREHSELLSYFKDAPDSPLKPLPPQVALRVAFRRSMRVGQQSGNEIEDFGVKPDFFHAMTRNDLLNNNEDLINHAADLLVAADTSSRPA